jgi:hypothetical protein
MQIQLVRIIAQMPKPTVILGMLAQSHQTARTLQQHDITAFGCNNSLSSEDYHHWFSREVFFLLCLLSFGLLLRPDCLEFAMQ